MDCNPILIVIFVIVMLILIWDFFKQEPFTIYKNECLNETIDIYSINSICFYGKEKIECPKKDISVCSKVEVNEICYSNNGVVDNLIESKCNKDRSIKITRELLNENCECEEVVCSFGYQKYLVKGINRKYYVCYTSKMIRCLESKNNQCSGKDGSIFVKCSKYRCFENYEVETWNQKK